jgi:ElaB/YqjD/DUF883 family membrane-anchored ribosome-binding protein
MRENFDNRSPEEIESDIERTRADFSSTIDAIQQKLTPREMMDQAVDYALSTTPGAFGANLVNSIRDNPIPVALIGLGVAWLMAAGRRPSEGEIRGRHRAVRRTVFYPDVNDTYDGASDYGSTSEGMLHRATSKASETAHDLKEKVSAVGQRISDSASEMTGRLHQASHSARSRLQESAEGAQARASEFGEQSRTQYYRAKDRVGHMIDEQPLFVGGLGVALGAALGAALPTTRRENELLGSTRDDLVGRVKETAREQAETLKQSAQRVAQVAKEEAERVKEDVASAVTQSKDQAGTASSAGVGGSNIGSIPGQQNIH